MSVTEFTVKRSEWGTGTLFTRVATADGVVPKRCCLGFLGNACGVSDEEMLGYSYPYNNKWPASLFHSYGYERDHARAQVIARINDNDYLTQDEKEKALTKRFNEIGIKVNFVD